MSEVVVDPLVIAVTPVVLYGIFEGDDSKHNNERDHGDLLLKGLHNWNPVQQHQEQEVQVCRSAKTCRVLSQSIYRFTHLNNITNYHFIILLYFSHITYRASRYHSTPPRKIKRTTKNIAQPSYQLSVNGLFAVISELS